MKNAVIVTITCFCVALQGISLFEVIAHPEKIRKQNVAKYEKKFAPVRRYLPTRGIVGYASDCVEVGEDPTAKMFSAQYALAPLIITNAADTPLVIGYSCNSAIAKPMLEASGMATHLDLGNGVVLLRRVAE